MPRDDDPIAALASGPPPAGVSVIRVSGPNIFSLLESLFPEPPKNWPERKAVYTAVLTKDGDTLDRSLGLKFSAPRSFTGEDTLELHCHGGNYIVKSLLERLYGFGVRAALPGEFTKRAFLNGKMDLSAAEGVHDLVTAGSHQQWQAARYLAEGGLKHQIEAIRTTLLEAMALFEARIDFPDEGDTADVGLQLALDKVNQVKVQAEQLLDSYQSGKIAQEGMRIVFVGPPNSGKSTLLNRLINEDRAIVTDVPGTTRDYIEVPCLIEGRLCRIFDTAGVRDTEDQVEKMGVQATLRLVESADLVIELRALDAVDSGIVLEEVAGQKRLVVYTKSDLSPSSPSGGGLVISAQSGQGLKELKQEIAKTCDAFTAPLKEAAYITNARQKSYLEKALQGIAKALAAHQSGQFDEMIAFELQQATRELSGIIGDVQADDVLEQIFSTFCVGK